MAARRNLESPAENLAAWRSINLSLGGYAPRQWVDRVSSGTVTLEAVPVQYQPLVQTYLNIAAARQAVATRS